MPTIEYVTVANHAEAFNGLLYLQGAGWTDMQVPFTPAGTPAPMHLGIGVSVLVGWNETDRPYPMQMSIVDEDGAQLVGVEAQVQAGRPQGLPPGSDLRTVLAMNAEMQFPKAGGYELRAELGEQTITVAFRVHFPPTAGQNPGGAASIDLPPGL